MYNTDKILWLHLYLVRLVMVSGGKRKPTGVVIWFVTELMCNLTNLAISSLFSFYFFPSFLSGKPKKDCSLDLAPLTSQALMDKKQWV